MTRLVRTKIDNYSIDEAVSLEEIEKKLNGGKEIFEEKPVKDTSDNSSGNENNVDGNGKIEKIIKFKNIEYIFDYEKITVSEEKYKKLKNGMTVLVGFKKFKDLHTVAENNSYCVYAKNQISGKKEFKGIVKVTRKSHDRVYLKREKYFI